jgi:tetratricopeptide (TPR) repeat protein
MRIHIALLSLLLATNAARGQSGGIPPVPEASALEQKMLADAEDGSLEHFSLWEASLIAAGVTTHEELNRRRAVLLSDAQRLRQQTRSLDKAQRARAAFDFLHRQYLTGSYHASCSDVRSTLDSEQYNCVTATILYHCLCRACDLEPQALATAGHVFSHFSDPPLGRIETTCREWFTKGRLGRTGQPPVTAPHIDEPRGLSPVQLVAKVYYNHGVVELEARRFAAAARALSISCQLDTQDQAAKANLLATLNNWALAESNADNFEFAADLLLEGLQRSNDYEPLLANDLHIHQKWALALCHNGKHEQALHLLEACYARRPEVELFDLGRFAVISLWARTLMDAGEYEQANQLLQQASRRYPHRDDVRHYQATVLTAVGNSTP